MAGGGGGGGCHTHTYIYVITQNCISSIEGRGLRSGVLNMVMNGATEVGHCNGAFFFGGGGGGGGGDWSRV